MLHAPSWRDVRAQEIGHARTLQGEVTFSPEGPPTQRVLQAPQLQTSSGDTANGTKGLNKGSFLLCLRLAEEPPVWKRKNLLLRDAIHSDDNPVHSGPFQESRERSFVMGEEICYSTDMTIHFMTESGRKGNLFEFSACLTSPLVTSPLHLSLLNPTRCEDHRTEVSPHPAPQGLSLEGPACLPGLEFTNVAQQGEDGSFPQATAVLKLVQVLLRS